MSVHRAGHDAKCERSATDPRRCRCDCGGALHGIQRAGREPAEQQKEQAE